jgi:ATP-dependent Clp protease ATP-binding subunit ClpB
MFIFGFIMAVAQQAGQAAARLVAKVIDPALWAAVIIYFPGIGPMWWFWPAAVLPDVANIAWLLTLGAAVFSQVTRQPLIAYGRGFQTRIVHSAPPTMPEYGGGATTGAVRVGSARKSVPLDQLAAKLKRRIIGQDHVIDAVVRGLQRREAGLEPRIKPFSVIAAGPTGVGKTETAKALAELLARPLLRHDMNNHCSEHTASALVGAPPGFVGSQQHGRLAADIASAPDAVLLIDELEKAHQNVLNVLLQMLDEGYVRELSMGMTADARNLIVVLTTNLLQYAEHTDDPARARAALVGAGMRPELANRASVVAMFRMFDPQTLRKVAQKAITDYLRGWAQTEGLQIDIQLDERVVDAIADRADARFGARDIRRSVEDVLGQALVQAYLPHRQTRHAPAKAQIMLDGDDLKVVLE